MLHQIFVQPLINLIVLLYALPPIDFGLAIIYLTILVRLVLWPLQTKTLRNQKALNKIQPEVKQIQQKYKNDPQKMQAKVMELYKEKEVNPLSSCLPSLIQLPLLFALFYAIRPFGNPEFINLSNPDAGLWQELYPWVESLGYVKSALASGFSTEMFGIINLAEKSVIFALLAGAAQFVQSKMMMPKQHLDDTQKAMSSMIYIFPVLTVIIGLTFAAALPLYWFVSTVILAGQQYWIMRHDIEELEEKK